MQKNPEDKRERYLGKKEQARLLKALDEHPNQVAANIIRFLMLTGARRGEVLNATWDQFDLEKGIWVKPSSHTKQRKLHRVPLSDAARELLVCLKAAAGNAVYVFPGHVPDQPVINIKRFWANICKTAELEDLRIHDLRHSFASTLVSSGLSLPVIGALLGHTQAQTTARYAHLYDDPLRNAANIVGSALRDAK